LCAIPPFPAVPVTPLRMVPHSFPDSTAELWRDPTSVVSLIEVPVHGDWVSQPLHALEEASGGRVAYVMRFGLGMLPTASTVIQDGDQIFMLVTDDMVERVKAATGGPRTSAQ